MNLPLSWDEISIKKFLEIDSVLSNASLEDIEKDMSLLAICSGLPMEAIEDIPLDEFKSHLAKLNFLSKIDNLKVRTNFVLGELKYTVCWELNKIKTGQYVDLSHFCKDQKKIKENIHNIMAVLCLPEGAHYVGKEFDARAKLFYDQLPIGIAYPLSVFFCKVWESSMPIILDYLERGMEDLTQGVMEEVMKAMDQPQRIPSTTNGGG